MVETISLNGDDWLLKDFYGEDWKWRSSFMPGTTDVRWWRSGSVPGSVLNDLWKLGEVPNPYFERNTLACEWVSQRTWLYRKQFELPQSLAGKQIHLRFKGVDYAASFYLNGVLLGSHTGMFTPVVFDVTGNLNYGSENLLAVVIEAAPHEQPQVGYTSKVRTHKSRMGYWWDFCPRVVHQGIWDDVFLEISGPVSLDDVFVRPSLAPDHETAQLDIAVTLNSQNAEQIELKGLIKFQNQAAASISETHTLTPGQTTIQVQTEVVQPQLWWPNGYGEQALYQAEIAVTTADGETHQREVTFGIRSLELVQNEDSSPDALPYTLVVNGQRIYIKGWNWVPIDVLYGVSRPEKLSRLIKLAKQAHVNLLRVWGGGLIEKDAFYEECDRAGILVWQEFIQSSSGIDNQPSSAPEVIEMLVHEAEQIIPLKRNHPSLALWCGGNELQSGDEQPLDDSHPTLAALKATVERLDPDRLWLATSPTGRVFGNSLENIARDPSALHDVHGPWEYQGAAKQYHLYNQGSSLLHSEFGVEGITNLKTLNAVIDPQHQWPISLDSNPYWWHLGAWWVRRKVWDSVFGVLPDVITYVRATQFTQYDGLRYALEADRRRKYHNSGTLPWQFNEPYPMAACTSAVDYFTRPKPAYYAVSQAYTPLHVSARFATLAWEDCGEFESQIWLHNSRPTSLEDAFLQVRLVGMDGKVYSKQNRRVSIGPDSTVQAMVFRAPLTGASEVFFLDITLTSMQRKTLAANRYVFTRTPNGSAMSPAAEINQDASLPPGYPPDESLVEDTHPAVSPPPAISPPLLPLLCTPPTTLEAKYRFDGDRWTLTITNTGETSAMFVWLEDARELDAAGSVFFSRNYFCLFPGETSRVEAVWDGAPSTDRRLSIQGWNTGQEITITDFRRSAS